MLLSRSNGIIFSCSLDNKHLFFCNNDIVNTSQDNKSNVMGVIMLLSRNPRKIMFKWLLGRLEKHYMSTVRLPYINNTHNFNIKHKAT